MNKNIDDNRFKLRKTIGCQMEKNKSWVMQAK